MKKAPIVSLILALLLASVVAAQTPSATTKICKGISIPDGYIIVEEVASPDCPKGAYIIKKPNAEVIDPITPKAAAAPITTEVKGGVSQLYEVHKIYIADMGKSDDSERFRELLSETLANKKFTIVDKPEGADAILQGVISTQLYKGTTRARTSVQLKSASGQRLWSGDFGVRLVLLPGFHRDGIKLRAEDVADGLRDDWKKSAKKAGVKVENQK